MTKDFRKLLQKTQIQCRFSPLPANLKYLTSISKSESFLPIHFLCTAVIPCSRLRCYLFLVSYARSSPCPSRAGFIKNIIRNKRQYIRISVPLFQHRKKRPYNLYIRIFNFLQECRVFLDMFWLPYE